MVDVLDAVVYMCTHGSVQLSCSVFTNILRCGHRYAGGIEGKGKQQMSQAKHDEIANRTRDLDRVREDPFATLLSARVALQNNER